MAAGMFSTGPCDAWMGDSQSSPEFVGHAANGVQINIEEAWDDHMNDLAGTRLPYDRSLQGTRGTVTGAFTRLDFDVIMRFLQQTSSPGSSWGIQVPGDIGTLMMTEGETIELWIRFPYAVAYPDVGVVNGFHFLAALFARAVFQDLKPGAATLPLTWECQRFFDVNFTNEFGRGRWILGDNDMSGIPAVWPAA